MFVGKWESSIRLLTGLRDRKAEINMIMIRSNPYRSGLAKCADSCCPYTLPSQPVDRIRDQDNPVILSNVLSEVVPRFAHPGKDKESTYIYELLPQALNDCIRNGLYRNIRL